MKGERAGGEKGEDVSVLHCPSVHLSSTHEGAHPARPRGDFLFSLSPPCQGVERGPLLGFMFV